MTTNETFKRRVRARMAATGERYAAARRILLDQSDRPGGRGWKSAPELSDELIRQRTGRGWDEWCALIDAWPGHTDGHGAVATWLQEHHGVDGWWAQSVTVGWERITGRRQPGQMADGTFTANKSATVTVDPGTLRDVLLAETGRAALFPGSPTELRSRPTSRNVRLAMDEGVAEIALDPKPGDRVTVTVSHTKLPSAAHVAHWRSFWGDWLAALDEGGS